MRHAGVEGEDKLTLSAWLESACQICNRPTDADQMILCDGCEKGYHMTCLNPPLTSIPSGDWWVWIRKSRWSTIVKRPCRTLQGSFKHAIEFAVFVLPLLLERCAKGVNTLCCHAKLLFLEISSATLCKEGVMTHLKHASLIPPLQNFKHLSETVLLGNARDRSGDQCLLCR